MRKRYYGGEKLLSETTRNKLLLAAIRMYGQDGFERVSIRQIASAVGIKESSIYNHFSSKNEILHSIMQYFEERHRSYWPSLEQFQADIGKVPLEDLLKRFFYAYPKQEYGVMMSMFRIIYMEQYRDEQTKQFFLDFMIDGQQRHIESALNMLVEAGELEQCDTENIARIWIQTNMLESMLACQNPGFIESLWDHPEEYDIEEISPHLWDVLADLVLIHKRG